MARSKEFDREVVLRKAVTVFRERGFEGTSIQVLVDQMGIHRASLYDTYGSKEHLFREALAEYEALVRARYAPILESTERAFTVIRRFFDEAVQELTQTEAGHASCLMLKSALSVARNLPDVPKQVQRYYDWFGDHFERLITRARAEGDVRSAATDPELGSFLRQTLLGAIAAAAVDGDSGQIRGHVERSLSLLLRD